MSRWFRFYADAYRNPKVIMLSDRERCLWMDLLCIASENDGAIPPLTVINRLLNSRIDHLRRGVEALCKAGLIDNSGDGYVPRNWGERQYISDSSTERVKKHREQKKRKCNVSVTPPDTDTDTDTEKEPKGSKAPQFSIEDFGKQWNELAASKSLSGVQAFTPKRKAAFRQRLAEHGADAFPKVIEAVRRSKFHCGENDREWKATFDFVLKPDKFVSLLEMLDTAKPTAIASTLPEDLQARWDEIAAKQARGEITAAEYAEATAPIFQEAKQRKVKPKVEAPPPAINKLIRQATNQV